MTGNLLASSLSIPSVPESVPEPVPEPVEGPVEGLVEGLVEGHTFLSYRAPLLSYRAQRAYLREQKRHIMLTDDGLMGVGEQKWPLVLTEIGFTLPSSDMPDEHG